MSDKEIVMDLLRRMPESASLVDICQSIRFMDAVRQGIAELDRGEGISIEDVAWDLPSFILR